VLGQLSMRRLRHVQSHRRSALKGNLKLCKSTDVETIRVLRLKLHTNFLCKLSTPFERCCDSILLNKTECFVLRRHVIFCVAGKRPELHGVFCRDYLQATPA
jgi:hypothetical protein